MIQNKNQVFWLNILDKKLVYIVYLLDWFVLKNFAYLRKLFCLHELAVKTLNN